MCKNSTSESTSIVAIQTGRCEASTPPVPVELQMTIIDNLHDDKDALARCALVCRSWQAPSQRNLFFGLHLYADHRCNDYCLDCNGEPPSGRALVDVKEFLVGTPRIGSYIQKVLFVGSVSRDGDYFLRASLVLDILNATPRLRVLEFHHIVIRGDLPAAELADNLFTFVSAIPCLKRLVFNMTDVFESMTPFVANSSSLPISPGFSQSAVSAEPDGSMHPFSLPLECLEIISMHTGDFEIEPVLSATIARPGSLSSLRHLAIDLACEHPRRLRNLSRFIGALGSCLNELCLDFSNAFGADQNSYAEGVHLSGTSQVH
ncbi:uncharacterized protein PHACADRAFT_183799 [Phanerochaete carnosa HHB-10118-sp]|uniref:F-box domain-containing protein n=1 Tax=Phanerochaete carnosa (strain HHB-10118-sp) TaxID=650164 RepID=K5X3J0_PHACS|nr:uncharacterized protein PHACADRAFT_183799 [Phanerochaete carnosa HHB-10118-sp]EKM57357.1 hypothetical protein PHACADRAFT_183799 [Phanerochaete carnosa HHB-10118-sp]